MKAKTYKLCIVCGKEKTIPKHIPKDGLERNRRSRNRSASAYVSRSTYERDPYCSRTCAEIGHGVVVATGPTN